MPRHPSPPPSEAPPDVSLAEQLRCAERELRLREHVYQRLVRQERMTTHQAQHELAAMRTICATLRGLIDAQAGQGRLFA